MTYMIIIIVISYNYIHTKSVSTFKRNGFNYNIIRIF